MHTPSMHVIVAVHSTGPRCCSENRRSVGPGLAPPALSAAEGAQADPRVGHTGELDSERAKPESYSRQRSSENMSLPGGRKAAFAAGYALTGRLIG
jgi:hypothetical protein